MLRSPSLRLLLLAAAAAVSGCDADVAPGYAPQLLVLKGRITRAPVALPSSLRVALGWATLGPVPQDGGFNALRQLTIEGSAQDVPVVDVRLPARFQLAVERLPEPSSFFLRAGGVGAAIGELLLYEDGNGNGRLDLTDPAGPVSPDRLFATTPGITIEYLEGPGNADAGVAPGFAALGTAWTVPPPCAEPYSGASAFPIALDQLDVELLDDPQPPPCSVAPVPFGACQPAPGAAVECNSDHSGYRTISVQAPGTVCEQRGPCASRECFGHPSPLCPL